MTGLEQEAVVGALRGAVDAQILSFERTDGPFRFRHALSREAVVAALFPPELERLSRLTTPGTSRQSRGVPEGRVRLGVVGFGGDAY